ncbi:MAG: von Willebrand factor type A domain-containing protein [Planctomycetes bacterium]|jgi:Ca-activated chloride channel family protein|nr:von Willebrand factor type A domain-containing protein [Planctomycetota bacterium]
MNPIHERIDDWIATAAAGGLTGDESRALADHLASCAECRAKHEEARQISDFAADAFAPAKPSEGFEDRAVEAFRRQAAKDEARSAPAAPRKARSSWTALRWGAAAAVVMVASVLAYGLGGGFQDGRDAGSGHRDYKAKAIREKQTDAEWNSVSPENLVGQTLATGGEYGRAALAGSALDGDFKAAAGKPVKKLREELKVGLLVLKDNLERDDNEEVLAVEGGRTGEGYFGRYGPSLENYDRVEDNPFRLVKVDALSTFSIDVDTASYSNVRRFLTGGSLPPASAVRIEELINYFSYSYPEPSAGEPFAVITAVASCPWNLKNRLVRIGIKGRTVQADRRPPSNLVFLVDVSGSMQDENKLPLVRQGLRMLVNQLTEDDHVAIVTYAGSTRVALESTPASNKAAILSVIDSLASGGSTAGAAGIVLAYEQAARNLVPQGVNRVILCTDGDFNVGITDQGDLVKMIEDKAKSGVFLTVLGFGMGNYKDSTLEKLADKGNGNYAYVDTEREARKVLVDQMSGTLVTIAKDVKIQVEFNPAKVGAWRLIGYENRVLKHEDFNDDTKDAGEIGAGHTVTALYEITLAGDAAAPGTDPMRYQEPSRLTGAAFSAELLTLKLRYKEPEGQTSRLIEAPVVDSAMPIDQASGDFRFAASVAAFGMCLRDSPYKGAANFAMAREMAADTVASDPSGFRAEFLDLVDRAAALKK